jgi:hypothetical protein
MSDLKAAQEMMAAAVAAKGTEAGRMSFDPAEAPDAVAPGSRNAKQPVQGWLCFAPQPFTRKHTHGKTAIGS